MGVPTTSEAGVEVVTNVDRTAPTNSSSASSYFMAPDNIGSESLNMVGSGRGGVACLRMRNGGGGVFDIFLTADIVMYAPLGDVWMRSQDGEGLSEAM
jgi:hypothetical protein